MQTQFGADMTLEALRDEELHRQIRGLLALPERVRIPDSVRSIARNVRRPEAKQAREEAQGVVR